MKIARGVAVGDVKVIPDAAWVLLAESALFLS